MTTDAPAPDRKIRLLIVDDHRSLAEALAMAVGMQEDIEVVGVAHTFEEGLEAARGVEPDVVLMDVQLPDKDGIDGTAEVKRERPETRVVILTGHADPTLMARAAAAGACGFLPKESAMTDVLAAIRTANEGGMLVQASTLPTILRRLTQDEAPKPQLPRGGQLTDREQEVLELLGQGMDPQTIARQLTISVHTCRGHVKSILAKLDAHSQLEAVVTAVRRGLLQFPA